MAEAARLRVHDVLINDVVAISSSPFTIGRREVNSLRLGGAEVSRDHAEIVRDGSSYVLRDKASRYGTFVNDVRITECTLAGGDRIRLGRSGGAELEFDLGERSHSISSGPLAASIGDLHQVAALLEGLVALGHARVLPEVLALVLDSAITLSGAERGFIMLASRDGVLEFELGRGRDRATLAVDTFRTSRKIPEAAFATGEIQVVRDLLEGDVSSAHSDTRALGIRHVLCAPLRVMRFAESGDSSGEERRLGVLYLDGRERGTLLSSTVRSALTALASEAAVAIENARLYREAAEKARMDQELRVAADIQALLLPHGSIETAVVEAAATSIACRSIGGDFFDYTDQAGGRFAFTLGDVAGKGPSAALLAALVQGMFSLAVQEGCSPASVVSRVNAALCRRGLESRFATLVHGVLAADGRLVYCNGGHNPPFVIGPSGVTRLDVGGTVVGLFEDTTYCDGVVQLSPGDRVLLFSDGVSEATAAGGEEYGDHRILALLQAMHATAPQADACRLVEALVADVRAFAAGAPQSDDVTAMVINYRLQPLHATT